MTREDETLAGSMNPRLNVVYELGLSQGKLGFTIILLKRGAAEFSNIERLQQIRFTDVREVFGDIVAIVNQQSKATNHNAPRVNVQKRTKCQNIG